MDKFSDILKDLIIESNKSLRTIGVESGVPHSQISRYVRNTIPKIDVSLRLAKYFDCSLDYLFGFTDHKSKFIDKYDPSKFYDRYIKVLNDNNITHWKFSHKYNISESGIRLWKHGILPKMETILVIADNLSCSIDYLLGLH